MPAHYKIELLGGLRVLHGGQLVTRLLPGRPGMLLAYLAFYADREHSRDELVDRLWPEIDPIVGKNRLRYALSDLRRQLDACGLSLDRMLAVGRLSLRLDSQAVETDVAEFEAIIDSANKRAAASEKIPLLTRAADIYRSELLPGYYDSWVVIERERLGQVHLEVLNDLTALLEEAGEYARALDYARRAIVDNPLREEAHCAAVRLYMALGRRLEAVRQYREMELLLREELGMAPSAMAQELWEQINAGADVRSLMSDAPGERPAAPLALEPVGGAVPLDSGFYIVRSCDADFEAAIARQDSILLVKGPRQVGKTSLLARGLQRARRCGAYVVSTDLQKLNQEQLASADAFYLASAQAMADQLNLRISPEQTWDTRRGPNGNFERYLRREVLEKLNAPLVWSLDEVDRLFPRDFSTEVFSLFRSWHNERALDPSGPWVRLTIVIAYATEAYLFIRDLNQSPFNVGTRLTLEDFTLTQVAELNRRHNAPLRNSEEVIRYFHLLGGNPYLVQRGLHEMVTRGLAISAFEKEAARVDGPFHDHLQRILTFLMQDVELREAVQNILYGDPCSSIHSFYRLRSAGIITGESPTKARLRCGLYHKYLEGQLA